MSVELVNLTRSTEVMLRCYRWSSKRSTLRKPRIDGCEIPSDFKWRERAVWSVRESIVNDVAIEASDSAPKEDIEMYLLISLRRGGSGPLTRPGCKVNGLSVTSRQYRLLEFLELQGV